MRNTIWGVILAVVLGIGAGVVIGGSNGDGESALKAQGPSSTTIAVSSTTTTTSFVEDTIPPELLNLTPSPAFSDSRSSTSGRAVGGRGGSGGGGRGGGSGGAGHASPTKTTAKTSTTAKTTTTGSDTSAPQDPPPTDEPPTTDSTTSTTHADSRTPYCRTDGGPTSTFPNTTPSQKERFCTGYTNP